MKIASSPVYLDNSALVKLYLPEAGSDEMEEALVGRRDVIVSDLAITELTSAISRRVRETDLTAAHARRIYTHREAERLLMGIGRRLPLRAADALHLGIAGILGARVMMTSDQRMRSAAEALGTMAVVGASRSA